MQSSSNTQVTGHRFRILLLVSSFITAVHLGCSSGESETLSFQEFMAKLPSSVCRYYLQCGELTADEVAECERELRDDVEELNCDAARGLYQDLGPALSKCVDGSKKACATTDDLALFCPRLADLERACEADEE